MSRVVALMAAAAMLAAPLPASAQTLEVPVSVGGDRTADACNQLGMVVRLNPNGEGFLAVRAGPSTDHAQVDALHNGERISLCEKNGRWWGIVYGGEAGCGVSSPVPQRETYSGPCKAGWVYDRYVDIIAG